MRVHVGRGRTSSKMWQLEFIYKQKFSIRRKILIEALAMIKKEVSKISKSKKVPTELVVVFVGASEGKRLNRLYRKRDYATDVLSFAHEDHLGPFKKNETLGGELVFCVPVLKKQAKENDLKLHDEFLYLFIHGVLHLCGYDHEKSKSQARAMFKIQDQIFEKLMQS